MRLPKLRGRELLEGARGGWMGKFEGANDPLQEWPTVQRH